MAGPVTAIAKALEYEGLDSREVFRGAGIRQSIRNDPTDRLSVSAAATLLKHCVKVAQDPYFGLTVAKFIRISNIHALGYALLASKTLLDFCLRLARHFALVTQSVKLHVEQQPHEVTVRFHPLTVIAGEAVDAWLAFMLHLMRQLYRPDFSPSRIEFRHPCPPAGPGPYALCFGVLPSFERPETMISFPGAAMNEPLSGASPELAQYNDTIAKNYLARLNRADVAGRVRVNIIERLSSGDCSRRKVACDVGMSEETLHHKLAECNTSFHELLNETRKELALGYLADRAISVTEITFLLGFADHSNFTRAFKRWTGISPTLYRLRLLQEQSDPTSGGDRGSAPADIEAPVLPSPAELRERSRVYLEAARDATDSETKRRFAAAFVAAQVAEAIEHDEQGANAHTIRLARVIADALAAALGARSNAPHDDGITAEERAKSDLRARIKWLRMRAHELRATADNFVAPSAQEPLRRAAANYEEMAEHAEALLTGKPRAPGEKAG